jgi:hypothetical protein
MGEHLDRPADLLAAIEEAASQIGSLARDKIEQARSFQTGPQVVRVVGPPHAERAAVAEWLASELSAAYVTEAAAAQSDPDPFWDVLVLVTPADRVLSLPEERYILDAAAEHRAIFVLVSRMAVFGDRQAQEEARREIEAYRIAPLLQARQIPWFFLLASHPPGDAALVQRISAAALHEGGHERAIRAFLRRQADELIKETGGLVDARRADQARLAALRQQLGAQRASLREALRTAVLGAIDRLRTDEENVYQSASDVVGMARAWLDSDGLVPWADVEYPMRRAFAALAARTERLVPEYDTAIRGNIARVEHMLNESLQELGLRPVGPYDAEIRPASAALDAAIARLREADPTPALSSVHQVIQDFLDSLRARRKDKPDAPDQPSQPDETESADGTESPDTGQGGGSSKADAIRQIIGGIAQSLPSAGPDADVSLDQARATLVQFLDVYLRPRVREVLDLAEEGLTLVGRTALDNVLASMERALGGAEAELAERYAWSGAYSRLVALRAEIG